MGKLLHLPLKENIDRLIDQSPARELVARDINRVRDSITTARSMLMLLKLKDEKNPHQEYYDLILDEINRANSTIAEMLS